MARGVFADNLLANVAGREVAELMVASKSCCHALRKALAWSATGCFRAEWR